MKQLLFRKHVLLIISSFVFALFLIGIQAKDVSARTIKIKTPEQLVDINWKNKGFGPGNTYVIANDMTLGDGEYATCRLTKGKFVIDFNGHTVQNANNALGVFAVSGATVTFKDSKVKKNKASIRSYGAGAFNITAGKVTILNGNYCGLSNGTNNPCALHVGGGSCVVNGGYYYGDTFGADAMGGSLYINGGTFQAGYMFALFNFGGTIKVTRGSFISGTTTYGYQMAIGAYCPQQTYDLNNFLASGSSFSTSFQTGYWNMQSQMSAYPTIASVYAVSYNTPTLQISSKFSNPPGTTIKKLKGGNKQVKVSWKKQTNGTTGYQIQCSTSKKFNKNNKTVTISPNTKKSATIKGLKSKKKYYVRIRTYKAINVTSFCSKWSKSKKVKVK